MPTYVQDKVTGKFVLKGTETCQSNAPMIMGDIEPFISPITKRPITSRSQLRRHNQIHGVTDSRDYSQDFMQKKNREREDNLIGNTQAARRERIAIIDKELRKHGI